MAQHNRRSVFDQVDSLRRHFAQAPGLPFGDVLAPAAVEKAFQDEHVSHYDCVYSPLTTVRLLLSQALDPDPSLRQAVSHLLAERVAQGQAAISTQTGAYSQARQRLPEAVLPRLTRHVGAALLQQAPNAWRWKGRDVKIVDGTTVSLADTPANQAAYPPTRARATGVGLPSDAFGGRVLVGCRYSPGCRGGALRGQANG